MQVGQTFKPDDRAAWRGWLARHHATETEIWLLFDDRPEVPTVAYLDAVEEALCFGWIDSLQKRHSTHERAQRFSPRRPRSNWTELNKERVRRLTRLGLMTDAGRATLPDMTITTSVPADIEAALKGVPEAWTNFLAFPELYRRIRVGYVDEMRRTPVEFERRLRSLVDRSAENRMFGRWDDGGRLR